MSVVKSERNFGGKRKSQSVPIADVNRRLAESLSASSGALRVQDTQERFRGHLFRGSEELFREFTGLRFEIRWESGGALTDDASMVAGQNGERGACSGGGLVLGRDGNGHGSVSGKQPPTNRVSLCFRGMQNFSHPIELGGLLIGVAVLQASQREPINGKARGTLASFDPGDVVVDGALFRRATMLLRLVIHDAVAATLAELRSEELVRARGEVAAVERKSQRPRGKIQRVVLRPPRLAIGRDGGSGVTAVVSHILDFVHASYPQPISLKDFARDHDLNPSYLSTVFSSNFGIPFKKYLTDFRVKKARELLRNSTAKISEVAGAVGYPDANRFLAVFKAATGFSPVAFRKSKARK